MTKVSRERHVEIRWIGDEKSEAAMLEAIGLSDIGKPASGLCERWMQVAARKKDAALEALKASGAKVLEPEP